MVFMEAISEHSGSNRRKFDRGELQGGLKTATNHALPSRVKYAKDWIHRPLEPSGQSSLREASIEEAPNCLHKTGRIMMLLLEEKNNVFFNQPSTINHHHPKVLRLRNPQSRQWAPPVAAPRRGNNHRWAWWKRPTGRWSLCKGRNHRRMAQTDPSRCTYS